MWIGKYLMRTRMRYYTLIISILDVYLPTQLLPSIGITPRAYAARTI
jgi:hypothetical protein